MNIHQYAYKKGSSVILFKQTSFSFFAKTETKNVEITQARLFIIHCWFYLICANEENPYQVSNQLLFALTDICLLLINFQWIQIEVFPRYKLMQFTNCKKNRGDKENFNEFSSLDFVEAVVWVGSIKFKSKKWTIFDISTKEVIKLNSKWRPLFDAWFYVLFLFFNQFPVKFVHIWHNLP